MENIYPNCYEIQPVTTDDGYMVFLCETCENKWLINIHHISSNETLCPYCGERHPAEEFYNNALEDSTNYYYMMALKNLLQLIDIDIDVIEQKTSDQRLRYKVEFRNIKNPTEQEMNTYMNEALSELKTQAMNRTLEIETVVTLHPSDIVNLDDFVEVKTSCCQKTMKVVNDHQAKHCIYCE